MKNIVITGSTKGIGYGYALEFAKRGSSVCISGRAEADVEAALERLRVALKGAARAIGFSCDVAKASDVQSFWDRAHREFGTIDIWINNAGFARSGASLMELTPAEIKTMVDSNVIGTINGCQVAVRGMTTQGHGHIYNTLGGGHDGRVVPGMIGYGTTKRAVRYFTDSMIDELKSSVVKIGKISPGVNISEGMLCEVMALAPAARKRMLWPLNVIGDYVETTTPWLVDRILADTARGQSGSHIAWMTTGKILMRFLMASFKKRDLFSRFGVSPV